MEEYYYIQTNRGRKFAVKITKKGILGGIKDWEIRDLFSNDEQFFEISTNLKKLKSIEYIKGKSLVHVIQGTELFKRIYEPAADEKKIDDEEVITEIVHSPEEFSKQG